MNILRNGSQASVKGPADFFTGAARIDPLFLEPDEPTPHRFISANTPQPRYSRV